MSLSLRRPPALRHRNFRLFFGGQLVSLIGTWMQQAAQSWLVYALTGSAEKLGVVSVVQAVPGLLLTAWGGVVADRYPKRSVLIATQGSAMLLALVMYGLVQQGTVCYEQIVVLAMLLGFVNAIDMPTRGAFMTELVGREDVHSAVALHSSIFNASRIIGPAVAGLVVASQGTAVCFLLNGVSFLGPITCLLLMRLPARAEAPVSGSPMRQMLDGLQFIRATPPVRGLVLLMAITSVLLWGQGVLLPVFAVDILAAGPRGYGFLMAFTGVGAVAGALIVSMRPAAITPETVRARVLGGVLVYSLASLAFAGSRTLALSFALQGIAGFASIAYFSTSNSTLQVLVPDALRGRVFGVYHTMLQGFMPLGSFIVASLAQRVGAPSALAITSGLGALLMLTLAFRERAAAPHA